MTRNDREMLCRVIKEERRRLMNVQAGGRNRSSGDAGAHQTLYNSLII